MTTVKIHTNGDLIRRIDALLNPLADEYKVRFSRADGIRVAAVDPANVGMVEFEVPPSAFESYDVDYDEVVAGLNLSDLSAIASYARKGRGDDDGDPITWVYDDETRRFYVQVERDRLTRESSFAAIDPNAIRQEPNLPGLSLPWETDLDSGTLRDVTRAASASCDHLQIAAEGLSSGVSGDETAGVLFYGETDVREEVFRPDSTATWVGDGNAEEVASLYSMDYLRDMAKDLHRTKPDSVKVEFGDEFPVKIRFSESDYGISGTFMLAPRIQKDGDDPGYSTPSFDSDLFEVEPDDDSDDSDDSGEEEAVAA
jgi:proliferating cell nuclear antigen